MTISHAVSGALYREVADVELLRPIQNEEQYERTLAVVQKLVLKSNPTPEELEYLDALSIFVEKYEEEKYPMAQEKLPPVELLKALMEAHKMNGSALGRLLGNRSLGGAILRGERKLSKAHIKTLSGHFRVSSDLFLL
jgi:HTH-type transcriptional regulator/antitoxin HigA